VCVAEVVRCGAVSFILLHRLLPPPFRLRLLFFPLPRSLYLLVSSFSSSPTSSTLRLRLLLFPLAPSFIYGWLPVETVALAG
jgi:hypothetical protein